MNSGASCRRRCGRCEIKRDLLRMPYGLYCATCFVSVDFAAVRDQTRMPYSLYCGRPFSELISQSSCVMLTFLFEITTSVT
eukprot:3266827-Rhodomonas_salina.1